MSSNNYGMVIFFLWKFIMWDKINSIICLLFWMEFNFNNLNIIFILFFFSFFLRILSINCAFFIIRNFFPAFFYTIIRLELLVITFFVFDSISRLTTWKHPSANIVVLTCNCYWQVSIIEYYLVNILSWITHSNWMHFF